MSLYCSAIAMASPGRSQPPVPVGQCVGLPRRVSVCCLAAILFVGCGREHGEREFAAVRPTDTTCRTDCSEHQTRELAYALVDEPVRECVALHGDDCKTWEVVSAIRGDGEAASPFVDLTLFGDGTWQDAKGLSGIWRINRNQKEIALQLAPFDFVARCRIVRLSPGEMVIEFVNHAPGMVLTMVSAPGFFAEGK